jgi:hypothetical protein
MFIEKPGTRGRRRELRRDVRQVLGVSSDPAPDAVQACRAAVALDAILRAATNDSFALSIHTYDGFMLDPRQALTRARAARAGGDG